MVLKIRICPEEDSGRRRRKGKRTGVSGRVGSCLEEETANPSQETYLANMSQR